MPIISPDSLILFIGDSITEWGRNRDVPTDLGSGFARMAAAWFSALYPTLNARFLNRGIGGNRITDLVKRWQTDCLDLKPNWITIMIGINDSGHYFNGAEEIPAPVYEAHYRYLLDSARQASGAQFILMEPFYLPADPNTPGAQAMSADLSRRIEVVDHLAEEYQATLVPLDRIFHAALSQREPTYWSPDGIHCSHAGEGLIAQSWMAAISSDINGKGKA
jgi:acyl-CoA thioesterase I